jgi:hypothetical protein
VYKPEVSGKNTIEMQMKLDVRGKNRREGKRITARDTLEASRTHHISAQELTMK